MTRLYDGPRPRSYWYATKLHRDCLEAAAALRRVGAYSGARSTVYRAAHVRHEHNTGRRLPA